MSSTNKPGTSSQSTDITGQDYIGPNIPKVVPSVEYRDYTLGKQKQNVSESVFSYEAYDPFGLNRGQHKQFGQQVPGQQYLDYPDPTSSQLGQSDTDYSIRHPSEEHLQTDPDSGRRAVYDLYEGQPVQGPAEWQYYYAGWDKIGDQYDKPIGRDEALKREELDFCEKYGFYFQKQLGRGSYGAVWSVLATRLFQDKDKNYYDQMMACKVLTLPKFKKAGDSVQMAVDKLLREAELHQKLEHRCIVRCEHVFNIHDQITGFPYCRCLMFMELCSGDLKALMDTLPDNRMTEDMAFHMFHDISDALKYMHDKNVCHLDIKINNVMYITDRNHYIYKLADFGISKQFGPTRQYIYGTIGTRLYMAPETIGPKKRLSAGKPIDIYCLGLLLAECLSGRARFRTMLTDLANWSDQVHQQYGVGQVCADLLTRMTDTDPTKRPNIDESFSSCSLRNVNSFCPEVVLTQIEHIFSSQSNMISLNIILNFFYSKEDFYFIANHFKQILLEISFITNISK